MLWNADDDRKLRDIGHTGPAQKPYYRKGCGFNRGGRYFGRSGGHSQPYKRTNEFSKSADFSRFRKGARYVSIQFYSSIKSITSGTDIVGGTVKRFVEFWPTLTLKSQLERASNL